MVRDTRISTKRRAPAACYRIRRRRVPRATEDSMSIQPRTRIGALATLLLAVMLPHGEARAQEPNPQLKVTTNMGEFVIEVRQDRAPLTAANFLRYVREGF